MNLAAILIISFVSSVAGVYAFRKVAERSTLLLDVPNERSSHSRPVVRGAGIAIVIVVLVAYFLIVPEANLVYVAAVAAVAIISFIDDLISIPLIPRLAVHLAAATAVVYWSGGYPGIALPILDSEVSFGGLAPVISILFIVWVTNAYNFMDGIDGIAGAQGVAAGLGWMLFGSVTGQPVPSVLGAAITGSCIGFLIFNWQPAKVFLGDVGSTFLGFTLASIPLISAKTETTSTSEALLLAVILLWLFLFDTLYTRLRQVFKLRPFWRAHREHLYQRAVIGGASHRSIALFFGTFALITAVAASLGSPGLKVALGLLFIGPVALLVFARKKRLT